MRTKLGKTVVCLLIGIVWGGVAAAGSFTDNGDGTVTDSSTGLIWQRQSDNTRRSWTEALAYCEAFELAGKSDWRLPDIRELFSIVEDTVEDENYALIDTDYFSITRSSPPSYWSSTSDAYNTSNAWYVGIGDGAAYYSDRGDGRGVRCVRGGQYW